MKISELHLATSTSFNEYVKERVQGSTDIRRARARLLCKETLNQGCYEKHPVIKHHLGAMLYNLLSRLDSLMLFLVPLENHRRKVNVYSCMHTTQKSQDKPLTRQASSFADFLLFKYVVDLIVKECPQLPQENHITTF